MKPPESNEKSKQTRGDYRLTAQIRSSLCNLGILEAQVGQTQLAETLLRAALLLDPKDRLGLSHLELVTRQLREEAEVRVLERQEVAMADGTSAPETVFELHSRTVDRRSQLSLRDFHTEYSIPQIPVVITDAPALRDHWTSSGLRAMCGDAEVELSMATPSQQCWAGLDRRKSKVLLRDFLDGQTPPHHFVFDLALHRACPEALQQWNVSRFVAQDYLQVGLVASILATSGFVPFFRLLLGEGMFINSSS